MCVVKQTKRNWFDLNPVSLPLGHASNFIFNRLMLTLYLSAIISVTSCRPFTVSATQQTRFGHTSQPHRIEKTVWSLKKIKRILPFCVEVIILMMLLISLTLSMLCDFIRKIIDDLKLIFYIIQATNLEVKITYALSLQHCKKDHFWVNFETFLLFSGCFRFLQLRKQTTFFKLKLQK